MASRLIRPCSLSKSPSPLSSSRRYRLPPVSAAVTGQALSHASPSLSGSVSLSHPSADNHAQWLSIHRVSWSHLPLVFSTSLSNAFPSPSLCSVLCSRWSGGKGEKIHASPSNSQDEAFCPLTTTWCLSSSLTSQCCCAKFFRPISVPNPLFPTLDQDSSVFITLAPQPCPHLVKPRLSELSTPCLYPSNSSWWRKNTPVFWPISG